MLDIQRISKTFNPGTVNEKKAITDLSLHLNKGEFVTVIGSNGAGKSTLFNAIAGSFYVDAGAITVGGHNMTFLPEYKRAKRIVAEGNITCLMVTHNMQQALELGTRTLMMADGRIVLDVSGADRAGMTVEDLIHRFKAGTGKTLSNDRMLLS